MESLKHSEANFPLMTRHTTQRHGTVHFTQFLFEDSWRAIGERVRPNMMNQHSAPEWHFETPADPPPPFGAPSTRFLCEQQNRRH